MPSNAKQKKRLRKEAGFLFLALILLAFGAASFYDSVLSEKRLRAEFESPAGEKRVSLDLEMALSPAERAKGLQFRKPGSLGEKEGMLFVAPFEQVQNFWMKNTYLTLDMIFLDSQLRVVGFLEEVPPLNETRRSIAEPSKYTVELLGGSVKKFGIQVGDKLVSNQEIPA